MTNLNYGYNNSAEPKAKSNRWSTAGIIIVLLIVIGVCNDSDEPKTVVKEKTTVAEIEEKKEDMPGAHLFTSPDDFREAFNTFTSANDIDLRLGVLKVQNGAVQNTFTQSISKNISVIGTVNKDDGSVKGILMIGAGDGTFKSGADIIICIGSLIAAADPGLGSDHRIDIMQELGFFGDDKQDILNLSAKTAKNGIRYSVTSGKQIGIMFSISRQ